MCLLLRQQTVGERESGEQPPSHGVKNIISNGSKYLMGMIPAAIF